MHQTEACVTCPTTDTDVKLSCPITGLNRPTGFQEVKAPRFLDNRHMNVVGCQP